MTVTLPLSVTTNHSPMFHRIGGSGNTASVNVAWMLGVVNLVAIDCTSFTTATVDHGVPNNIYWISIGF